MAVFRVHKNENYTVLSNYHFREKGMSLKAKGLLSLMLSLPESWDYSAAGLVTLSKDGKDSVNAALKELEKFGYLRRTQAISEDGKFSGYNYEIYEQPSDAAKAAAAEKATAAAPKAAKPTTEKPFAENPSTGKPTTENPPQLNTDLSSTKKLNTDISSTEEEERKKKAPALSGYDAIINELLENEDVKATLYEFIKMRKLIKKPLTDFALRRLIKKLQQITTDPQEQIEVLEKSIVNSWQDIFPLKAEQPKKQASVTPLFEDVGEIDPDDVLQTIKTYVMLSENQIADLLDKLGLEAFDFYVEKLANYIKEHGNVKSHYKTILKWYREDSAVAR